MNLWKWMGREQKTDARNSGDDSAPKVERLEPRLLLDADALTGEPLVIPVTPPGEQAITAELNPAGDVLQEDNPSLAIPLSAELLTTTVGNTTVFEGIATTATRRAVPYTVTETGQLLSVSIYHQGGSGQMLLGVYADNGGLPGALLGGTAATAVNSVEGWQTVALQTPVAVTSGQTIWLAWIFQSSPGVRYTTGSPGRVESGVGWSGGMPDQFGPSTQADYIFSIFATYASDAQPEVVVEGNGVSIADGDTTPGTADHTDFGSVAQGGAAISRTFTVRNDGSAPLTLGAVSVPTGFTLVEGLSGSLAAGASDTFTVRLDTAAAGTFAGEISFTTNDADENPFNFRITGTVVGGLADWDPTFGDDGIVTTGFASYDDRGRSVALQSDGKIVVAGFTHNGSNYDFAVARYNADGSLDTTFGVGGKITTAVGAADDQGYSVAVQSDGKIVVVGYSTNGSKDNIAVVRYNADGSLDTAFGVGGKVTTAVGSLDDHAFSVAIQSDGKIVVVGESNTTHSEDFAVIRYNVDGSLDTSFGGDGIITTGFRVFSSDIARSVVIQSDGKIVVGGSVCGLGGDEDFALARYNTDGTLDTSFGTDGMVTTILEFSHERGTGMALQPDGKIVVAGYVLGVWDFALMRYNADGSLDTSFGVDGRVTTDLGSLWGYGYGVALQSDGKIVVAGESGNASDANLVLLRYTTGGALDASFGVGGKVTMDSRFTDFEHPASRGYSVAIQPDGRIVVAGEAYVGNVNYDFAVARYGCGASPATDITVSGNGVSIPDGDTTPSAADWTDFGSVNRGGTAISRAFTVRNDGASTLTLGAVTVPTGFTLVESLSASLAPGASDTFTVRLDTAVAGTKSGEISFTINGSDENPFNFRITGRISAGPEITVLGNEIAIADGDTTPSAADHTDFGAVIEGGAPVSRIFTVRNDTGSTMTLGAVTVPTGFTLLFDLPSSLAPGASATFRVQLDPAVIGTKTGDISFTVNGSSETPFNFRIAGLVRSLLDGDLDPTFGSGGKVITAFGEFEDSSRSVAVQPDGKIVVAGTSGYNFALVRYNANGSLDTSFGVGGKVTTGIGPAGDYGNSVAIQSDGSIVVAGYSENGSNEDFAVVRYNADGSLDTSFDGDGKVTTDLNSSHDRGYGVIIQSDGKIVVVGYSYNGARPELAVVRYNPDGSLDTSFGGDGKVTTAVGSSSQGYSVAIQSDGKIVVAGTGLIDYNCFAVVRYNADGSLDTSFGVGGKVTTDLGAGNEHGYSVAIQSDGKIVVVGTAYNGSDDDFAVVRYNADGSLDTSFNGDGKVTTAMGTDVDTAYSVAIQSDGKIVVAGNAWWANLGVVRYNVDGSLDTSFGGDGKVITDLGSFFDEGHSVAIQPDGKIVVAGDTYTANRTDFAVVRYISGVIIDAEVAVQGNGVSITNGDTTPSTSDHTDFGSVAQGGAAISRTFTVRNSGTSTLIPGLINVPTGFTLTKYLAGSLAPGASDTFTVQLDTAVAGTKSGDISFSTNDSDENPFSFRITGTVTSSSAPEVTVLGNGISIESGDAIPSTTDHTDFGTVNSGGPSISRTFTIRNDGAVALALGSLSVPSGFTLVEGLSSSLAPGASDTFTIQLDNATAGIKSGDISFATNDSDENPFNFRIAGTVIASADVTVRGNGITIVNGDTTPSLGDWTDFGSAILGAAGVSRAFWVRNDGGLPLTIGAISVPAGFTLTQAAPTTLEPGVTGSFVVRLDTATAGTKSGVISFTTNDPDENPFSFSITGTVLPSSPDVTVLGNGRSISDGDATPQLMDHTDFISVEVGSTPVSHTFTVRNDGSATLTLGPVSVPAGFTLSANGLVSSLAPGASDTFTVQLDTTTAGVKTGDISFSTNDPDENPFNFRVTGTVTNPAITVLGNGVSISDGDTTPDTADHTDFGTTNPGGPAISRTFTVRNNSTGTRTLGSLTVPTGFTLTEGLSASLAAGASDSFTVRLDTATAGTKSGDVSFLINAESVNPFTFRITGLVQEATFTVGNTAVFSGIATTTTRRAVPYTVGESGQLTSISIYHQGGSGQMLLGVYADNGGMPGSLLGRTALTTVNSAEGWQTISLQSPVSVSAGQTIWLAWVFENGTGVRYTTGTPGRVDSGAGWSGAMPDSFGAATQSDYIFSIYAICTR